MHLELHLLSSNFSPATAFAAKQLSAAYIPAYLKPLACASLKQS